MPGNTDLGFNVYASDRAGKTFLDLAGKVDLLTHKLDKLDRQRVNVNVDVDTAKAESQLAAFTNRLRSADGRMANLVQTSLALAPAFVPLTAAAIPAVAGLSTQLALAAGAAGVTALAFNGIGTALDAVNKYQLDPTEAHLKAMRIALKQLGPDGQQFVQFLHNLEPQLHALQDLSRRGLLPGAEDGITHLLALAPQVQRVVATISTTLGDLADEAGAGLGTADWQRFIGFLDNDARPVLLDMGHTLGHLVDSGRNLFMALDPMAVGFADDLERGSAALEHWTASLAGSQGFESFLEYVQRAGPAAWDTLTSLGNALLQIVEATAPVGTVVLPVIRELADVIATFADSPAGPVIIGLAAAIGTMGRAMALLKAVGLGGQSGFLTKEFVTPGKSAIATMRELTAATEALTEAEAAAARERAFPTSIGNYTTALRNEQVATERVVKAQDEHSAAMSKARTAAMRAGAGMAGLGLMMVHLGDDTTTSGKVLSTFQDTASGALMGFAAGGPIGAAIGSGAGLLLGLGKAFLGSSHDAQEAAAANRAYAGTLDQVSGAVTKATAQMVAQRLEQAGALKQIAQLGLDPSLGVDAVLGKNRAAAINAITQAYDHEIDALKRHADAQVRGRTTGNALTVQVGRLTDQRNHMLKVLGVETDGLKSSEAATRRKAQAVDGASAATSRDAAANQKDTDATFTLAHAIDTLTAAQKRHATAVLAASDKEIAYQQAIDDATAAAKNNKHTLDINTQAGRDNRSALNQLAATWNDLPGKVQNAKGAYNEARHALVSTAEQMGATRKQAQRLASQLLDTPKHVNTQAVLDDKAAIADIAAYKRWLQSIDGKTATTYVRTIHEQEYVLHNKATAPTGNFSADGKVLDFYAGGGVRESHVAQIAPAGSWRVWAEPETGGEAYIPLAPAKRGRSRAIAAETVSRLGGGVQWFADGGVPNLSLDQRVSVLELMQQIRGYLHQLNANGDNAVKGLNRRLVEVQLEQARRQLRQAQRQPIIDERQQLRDQLGALRGVGGLDVSSALGLQPRNPTAAGVRGQIAQFRDAIKQAGGEWTKAMQRNADRMIRHAQAIDRDERAIDRDTNRRDKLSSQLDDLNSKMDQLHSTMDQFGGQVAGNFLTSPFGLGGQSSTLTPTVQNSPALSAATDQLNAAKAHLSALQSPTGSLMQRLANSAEASRVERTVASLQAQVDSLSQPITTTTSALDAFEDTLRSGTKDAQSFLGSLTTLSGELDKNLFSQLAQSGDVGLAQQLAALPPAEIDQINQLDTARSAAAAQVAALATQTVYGQQQAQLQAHIDRVHQTLTRVDRTLTQLDRQESTLGQRVQNGAKEGVAVLRSELQDITEKLDNLPRQLKHHGR